MFKMPGYPYEIKYTEGKPEFADFETTVKAAIDEIDKLNKEKHYGGNHYLHAIINGFQHYLETLEVVNEAIEASLKREQQRHTYNNIPGIGREQKHIPGSWSKFEQDDE